MNSKVFLILRYAVLPAFALTLLSVPFLACSPNMGVANPNNASTTPKAQGSQSQTELVIFAASSLLEVFREIGSQFEQQHPGVHLRYNFAGSAQLVAQLSQGAQASVVALADTRNMRQAEQQGVIAGEPIIFARNRLILIVPAHNPAGIATLADLARPGVKVVLAHDNVPIGHYARRVLEKASQNPSYGADFAQRVLANLVSEEVNVKQVVAKIQLGEADAALVYATDITPAVRQEVQIIELPQEFNVVTCYPIALVAGARNPELARAFIDHVLSSEGQEILARYGFRPASQGTEPQEACE